jgi:hypothetical protein
MKGGQIGEKIYNEVMGVIRGSSFHYIEIIGRELETSTQGPLTGEFRFELVIR